MPPNVPDEQSEREIRMTPNLQGAVRTASTRSDSLHLICSAISRQNTRCNIIHARIANMDGRLWHRLATREQPRVAASGHHAIPIGSGGHRLLLPAGKLIAGPARIPLLICNRPTDPKHHAQNYNADKCVFKFHINARNAIWPNGQDQAPPPKRAWPAIMSFESS